MGFKCGIVGLPNVGKSTLFNALTAVGIASENYPFCTIEANVGAVAIPDPRGVPQAAVNNWGAGFLPAVFQGTALNMSRPVRHLAAPAGVIDEQRHHQNNIMLRHRYRYIYLQMQYLLLMEFALLQFHVRHKNGILLKKCA